jgi:predicted Rossmann fold nucleotide-binding protein DprA/Smf involved in DNA uptake
MQAGIVGKGTVVGVLADSLLKESGKKPYRDAIREGRMCLMSEVHPEANFDVGNAMARNRLAYACADAALVVECDPNRGGTWAGALEALKEGKTVYVLKGAKAERELVERGAIRIDMSFALQPDRLIRSERPEEEVPETAQLAQVVLRFLGNPVRPEIDLLSKLNENPHAFLEELVQAAISDGIVEVAVSADSITPKPKSKPRAAKPKRQKSGNLFAGAGLPKELADKETGS